MVARTYILPFLTGVGFFALALFFPILVLIVVAGVSVGVNLASSTWAAIWSGIAAGSGGLLVAGAYQLRRAWRATDGHPQRGKVVAILLLLVVLAVAGTAVFILANIENTCDCPETSASDGASAAGRPR
jgi:hypothetical protein